MLDIEKERGLFEVAYIAKGIPKGYFEKTQDGSYINGILDMIFEGWLLRSEVSQKEMSSNEADKKLDETNGCIDERSTMCSQIENLQNGIEVLKEPSDEAIQKAIKHAQSINLSCDYTWYDYMKDLYKIMTGE